jgi:hypothetical protein
MLQVSEISAPLAPLVNEKAVTKESFFATKAGCYLKTWAAASTSCGAISQKELGFSPIEQRAQACHQQIALRHNAILKRVVQSGCMGTRSNNGRVSEGGA